MFPAVLSAAVIGSHVFRFACSAEKSRIMWRWRKTELAPIKERRAGTIVFPSSIGNLATLHGVSALMYLSAESCPAPVYGSWWNWCSRRWHSIEGIAVRMWMFGGLPDGGSTYYEEDKSATDRSCRMGKRSLYCQRTVWVGNCERHCPTNDPHGGKDRQIRQSR